jgi:hypothetical protein
MKVNFRVRTIIRHNGREYVFPAGNNRVIPDELKDHWYLQSMLKSGHAELAKEEPPIELVLPKEEAKQEEPPAERPTGRKKK